MDTRTVSCPKCKNSNFYTASDKVIRCQYCGSNIFITQKIETTAPLQQPPPLVSLYKDDEVLDSVSEDYELADMGQRLVNFIVDLFFSVIFWMLLSVLMAFTSSSALFFIAFMFGVPLYYVFFEARSGRTIGKRITGTRAVNEDGSKITFGKAFTRTLCRMIPFEIFSIFLGNGVCWHDILTRTRVIKER